MIELTMNYAFIGDRDEGLLRYDGSSSRENERWRRW